MLTFCLCYEEDKSVLPPSPSVLSCPAFCSILASLGTDCIPPTLQLSFSSCQGTSWRISQLRLIGAKAHVGSGCLFRLGLVPMASNCQTVSPYTARHRSDQRRLPQVWSRPMNQKLSFDYIACECFGSLEGTFRKAVLVCITFATN